MVTRPFPDFPANPAKWCRNCLILEKPEPTNATLLYLEAKRSWRWSEGPSEGIRRIRRGFPEEEPSDTANERGQAQAAPSGGAAIFSLKPKHPLRARASALQTLPLYTSTRLNRATEAHLSTVNFRRWSDWRGSDPRPQH